MKSLVENAKEFADIFLFLFSSESHLRYYLKAKRIGWAASGWGRQEVKPQMA